MNMYIKFNNKYFGWSFVDLVFILCYNMEKIVYCLRGLCYIKFYYYVL